MTEAPQLAPMVSISTAFSSMSSSLDLAHDLARVGRNGIGRLDDVAIATGHARGRLDGGYLRLVAELARGLVERILELIFGDVAGIVYLDRGAARELGAEERERGLP